MLEKINLKLVTAMNFKNIIILFLFPLLTKCHSINKVILSEKSSILWKLDSCGLKGYRDAIIKNDFLDRNDFEKKFLNRGKAYIVKNLGYPNGEISNKDLNIESYLYVTLAAEEKGRVCNASIIESITLNFNIKTQKIERIEFSIY